MPRNIAKHLDPADNAVQRVRQLDLSDHQSKEHTITVSYIKRDGTKSSSRGRVAFFSGTPGMDTGSVTIDTEDKGPRTINLHRIVGIDR